VQVKAAMNDINAAQRLRVAAADKAEAAKIKVGGTVHCTDHGFASRSAVVASASRRCFPDLFTTIHDVIHETLPILFRFHDCSRFATDALKNSLRQACD
jgi:hypothetical protein